MTVDAVKAFLRRLGYPEIEPIRIKDEGIVNSVWIAGEVVVRVNKDPEYEDDCFCEAIAHPLARAVSELTPEWLHSEAKAPEFGVPVSVLSRVEGVNLTLAHVPDLQEFYIELALAAKTFHESVSPKTQGLDDPWTLDPFVVLRYETGLDDRIRQLHAAGVFAEPIRKQFVHQDLHANNVMVRDGKLAAVIDWGDAAIGDPACDLRFIPARFMEAALDAYGADEGLRWRAKLHALDQFFYCRVNGKSYGPNADSTYDEVVALFR